MSSFMRSGHAGLAGLVMAAVGSGALASPTLYTATQVPKAPLTSPAPPTLTASVSSQLTAFSAATVVLGKNEFESSSLTSSYTGGTATVTGGASIVNGDDINFQPISGRYNMTAGLGASRGKWIESTTDFSIGLTSAINAFSFFATDLGDYDGTVTISFLSGGINGTSRYSQSLVNTAATNGVKNGNLLYYGIVTDFFFDTVKFSLTKSGPDIDVLGLDSLTFAAVPTIPEPASLALVGLALAGLGLTTRRSKAV